MTSAGICFAGLSTTTFFLPSASTICNASLYFKRATWATKRRSCLLSSLEQPSPQYVESHDASFSPQAATDRAWERSFEHSNASSDSNLSSSSAYDGGTDGGSSGVGGFGGDRGRGHGESDDVNPNDESLPEDMKAALLFGSLTRDALNRYYKAMKNPVIKLLLGIPAFRSRFLMDASFLFKLLVQEVIGNGTALASEIVVRGKDIVHEVEYVASDLIVGTVIEAAFVWLLAPTLSLPNTASTSAISRYISSLPAHIFQPSNAVRSFTTAQRVISFLYAAMQYAAIGFAGGVVGTAITYALLEARKRIDKNYSPFRPMPPVIPNSAGWAAFMALSSNTRFQLVEGLEMGVAKLLSGTSRALLNSVIVTLRFINNYWGGVQFVQFFRAIGLHATGE